MHFASGAGEWSGSFHYNKWVPLGNRTDCGDAIKCGLADTAVRYDIDLIALCALFAFWSSVCHLVASLWLGIMGHARKWLDWVVDVLLRREYTVVAGADTSAITEVALRTIRMIDYAVSAPAMLVVVSIVCGSNDYGQLIGTATAMSAVILVDYFGSLGSHPRAAYAAASAIYIGLWIPIWMNFEAARSGDGDGRAAPDFVLYIVIGLFLTFSSFALLRLWAIFPGTCCGLCLRGSSSLSVGRRKLRVDITDFIVEDSLFVVLSMTSKVQLHWMLYFSVFRPMTADRPDVPTDDADTDVLTVLIVAFVVGIALAISVLTCGGR